MEHKDEEKTRDESEEKEGVSRRKWLIDGGKPAALAGSAGKAGPREAEAPAGPAAP